MDSKAVPKGPSTVMGPEDELAPSSILVPPKLRTTTDKLQWREAVRDWALNLQICAKGGDNRAKGAAASIGLTLYRSLEFNKKELVKKAMKTGELSLVPQDSNQAIDQNAILEKILNIVAKDSAVDTIKRMVRLNKEIHGCVRKKDETISFYVERFSGPAQAYLNLVNANQDGADSQNFAIVLLVNARVSTQTFTNLVSSLVSTAKHRSGAPTSEVTLTEARITIVLRLLQCMQSAIDNKEILDTNRIGAQDNIGECTGALKAATLARKGGNSDGEMTYFIGLQDAITALEEAGLEEKDLDDGKKGEEQLKPTTAAMMGIYGHRTPFHGTKRKRGHWRSRKQQEEREREYQGDSDTESNGKDLRETIKKNRKPDKYFRRKKQVSFEQNEIEDDQDKPRYNTGNQHFQ